MKLADLNSFLASYPGGVSIEEGLALSQYAEQCLNNVIVEIGSFKGKSARRGRIGSFIDDLAPADIAYLDTIFFLEAAPQRVQNS
jgi:hypothetical protein